MADLKLIALEKDDLPVLSAHLQDAVLRMSDLAWMPRDKRFVLVANRFDWDAANARQAQNKRHRTALRFEHVLKARVQGLDLTATDTILSLLAIQFEDTDPPGGTITLIFAGDGAIQLTVECIEGELRDVGPAWSTQSRPTHSIVEATDGDASFDTET